MPPLTPTVPSYLVYAGWYGHLEDGWDDTDWTYGFWQWYGPDLLSACQSMAQRQEEAYDFVGMQAVPRT